MCPACIATAALVVAGVTSAGGLAAVVARKRRSPPADPEEHSRRITMQTTALPPIVTQDEWEAAHEAFLTKEKEMTRALDALAAERRRLPMVRIETPYAFDGPQGKATLLDLFDGRRQLIIYHFMFAPDWEEGCIGCSMLTDHIGPLEHLNVRDTTLVLVSRAPLDKLERYRERMGWKVPWYSSFGSDFNYDFGVSHGEAEHHGLSVFLRDGEDIYRTYFTTDRGCDRLNANFNYLDLTPYGRQELWEDSPDGWPQSEPYVWWRRHDQYDT